ncbi:LysR family transcriptional regulator [Bacterioplanes sanyensis]|uniref:LysR family transcriptional regulator n=1 Tax=Bacterioplanes sanyensis TaxID=1249553 RepID=A0A222FPK4_9GAMM|nr:LysR family transcriptional regulator [Bacterioplanes sanyensis]ASP40456.1 LysR family transcriptional regulator [Bacterioplanes sanyensis]
MRFTLRQLEVFLAVAQHNHLTRAAESLAMSQSAASSALRDIEQQFDVQLFDRHGKRLQLNEQGRLLLPKAESLLVQARELEQQLSRHSTIGNIKVGATLSIGNYLVVPLMASFMTDHPGTRVTLDVANTRTIVEELLDFQLDIGLIEGEINHPHLHIEPWMEDELAVFCHPHHPLAERQRQLQRQGQSLKPSDVIGQPWIVRESGSGTRQAFERAFHGWLPEMNIQLELQHTEAIKRAVEAELGLGCLSSITLRDAFERGRLVALHLPQLNMQRRLYLAMHRQKFKTAGIEAWLDLCRGYAKNVVTNQS